MASKNHTLQKLWLHQNQIGDAGASQIAAGLAYVVPYLYAVNVCLSNTSSDIFFEFLGQH
jgi:hypothetical protein